MPLRPSNCLENGNIYNQYIFRGLSPQSSPVRGAIEFGSPPARGGMIRGGVAGR